MSNFAPVVDRIRIIPRPDDFLGRNVGASGEVFFNRATNSLRVYSGKDQGGFEIARSDFGNILPTAQLDIQSQKNRIRFHWDTLSDLENEVDPVTYHGMIAHVHSEGRLYFAHAAEWVPVANLAEALETDIPYEADTRDELQWVEGTWDFGNNIIKYANAIQLEEDLANYDAGVYHGMTMHVHETGALYYAHAGAWRKLLTDTAHSDVESAGYVNPLGAAAYSNAYSDLDGAPQSILDFGITDGGAGEVLTTDGAGSFAFTPIQSSTGSSFDSIVSDDGSFDPSNVSDLRIIGGINISTEVVTDSNELSINLDAFSIGFLSDVDTVSNPPTTGEVLKWDGAKWAPGTDVAEGGSGLDADTLDGQDGSYYLNYNNFTNTPSVLTLSDISVGNELLPSGNGAISYDNTVGEFRYTPPTAEGIGALTTVSFADLTSTPTTLAGYGITDAFSGDYNDLSNTPVIPESLLDLGISDGANGQVLTTDGAGNFSFATVTVEGTGGDPDQNLFATVTGDSGSTTADSISDTLTIAGGTGIITSVSGDTVTISQQDTSTSFGSINEVNTAGLTIDKVYEPALLMFRVNNVGASAYTFAPHYSDDNPTILVLSGATVAFDLDEIGGHPFAIQDPTGENYSVGLIHVDSNGTVSTGNDAQGKDFGTLYWRIPEVLSGTYRYQCLSHAAMVGGITIKRFTSI